MMWIQEWRKFLVKINGLQGVTEAYFRSVSSAGSDYYGISNSTIIPSINNIQSGLKNLKDSFNPPVEVKTSIESFLKIMAQTNFSGIAGAGSALTLIGVLKAELEYYANDPENIYKTQAERAFLHLNRTLCVDESFRAKWVTAFSNGEVAIEKLSALHFLLHGLWAFKVDAKGERTDLIIQEKVNLEDASRAMAPLVLTEWKGHLLRQIHGHIQDKLLRSFLPHLIIQT